MKCVNCGSFWPRCPWFRRPDLVESVESDGFIYTVAPNEELRVGDSSQGVHFQSKSLGFRGSIGDLFEGQPRPGARRSQTIAGLSQNTDHTSRLCHELERVVQEKDLEIQMLRTENEGLRPQQAAQQTSTSSNISVWSAPLLNDSSDSRHTSSLDVSFGSAGSVRHEHFDEYRENIIISELFGSFKVASLRRDCDDSQSVDGSW